MMITFEVWGGRADGDVASVDVLLKLHPRNDRFEDSTTVLVQRVHLIDEN